MKQFFLIPILVHLSANGLTQTESPLSAREKATEVRIEDPDGYERGKLYITIGGKEKLIGDVATGALVVNGGKEVVYSASDGAGGYENEG